MLKRAGHTEAATDLLTAACLADVGVIGELIGDDGTMLSGERLTAFARRHRLALVAIADLVRWRRSRERLVRETARATMPTVHGEFEAIVYEDVTGTEHLALVHGTIEAGSTQVRVHSECLTGDIVGSLRCDCGPQFEESLRLIAAAGAGVAVYLRGHEGRGIGLGHKLRAYLRTKRDRMGHDLHLTSPTTMLRDLIQVVWS